VNHIYQNFIRPLLFKLNPEQAHDLACNFLSIMEKSSFSRKIISFLTHSDNQATEVFGIKFPNKLGLAAGMDKNAKFPKTSAAIGFGHVEIGTITPQPQSGNPKPRLFRYPNQNALVNRMGFNNDGAEKIIQRIQNLYPKKDRVNPLGINIGKSKETPLENAHEDYIFCLKKSFKEADYITVNISSPNTKNLRDLHKTSYIEPLLKTLVETNKALASSNNTQKVPLLLKVSPDENMKSIENIVCLSKEIGFSGVIATNTSVNFYGNEDFQSFEKGGLSGKPLNNRSNNIIKFISRVTDQSFPIIGVGGINDTESAIKKLDSGASLLQIYSSLVFEGPFFPSKLIKSTNYRNKLFF